jgi:Zn-dependent oligopeptidase
MVGHGKQVDRLLRDYRRSGLDLAEAQRDRMKALQTELTQLCLKFSKTVDDDATKAEFTRDQLFGMSDDEVGRYKQTVGSSSINAYASYNDYNS